MSAYNFERAEYFMKSDAEAVEVIPDNREVLENNDAVVDGLICRRIHVCVRMASQDGFPLDDDD